MAELFTVTYGIVTPESAEHGDYAEHGFIQAGEWHHSTDSVEWERDGASLRMNLATALRHVTTLEDSGRWFSGVSDYETDYKTGATETRDLHPPQNVTAASYGRLRRVLKAKGYLVC